MLKKVFLLAVFTMLIACQQSEPVPEHIIDEERMIGVLIDIRTAEGRVNALNLPTDSAQNLFNYVEKKILMEHEIDSANYMESFEYYMLDAEKYLKITDTVIDSLKVRLQKVTSSN